MINKASSLRVAGFLLLFLSCEGSATAGEMPVANVVVATALSREVIPSTFVSGTIISRYDARIAAQVEGQVIEVASVGRRVQLDDVIARLDDVLVREQLAEQRASVSREQANVDFHKAEVKRLQALAKEHNAALSRLDQERRDLAIARSEVAAARARLQQSKQRLDRAHIKAPFSGIITERYIQPGEWAEPGSAIVRLVDTSTLEAQARVSASVLPYIKEGSDLQLRVAGQEVSGRVIARVPVGDNQSRLYEIRLSLQAGSYSAGQSVRIEIPASEPRRVTMVPRDALVLRRDSVSVFRVQEGGMAEEIPVTTGIAQGELIEVQGEIHPDDQVIVRGGERLRFGQKVNVIESQVSE